MAGTPALQRRSRDGRCRHCKGAKGPCCVPTQIPSTSPPPLPSPPVLASGHLSALLGYTPEYEGPLLELRQSADAPLHDMGDAFGWFVVSQPTAPPPPPLLMGVLVWCRARGSMVYAC